MPHSTHSPIGDLSPARLNPITICSIANIWYSILAIEQIVEEIKLLEIILAIVMQFTSNNLRLVGEPITFLSCISSIIPTPQHTGLI